MISVSSLIEYLQEQDPDLPVYIHVDSNSDDEDICRCLSSVYRHRLARSDEEQGDLDWNKHSGLEGLVLDYEDSKIVRRKDRY